MQNVGNTAGSGKTYTMMGSESENPDVQPLCPQKKSISIAA